MDENQIEIIKEMVIVILTGIRDTFQRSDKDLIKKRKELDEKSVSATSYIHTSFLGEFAKMLDDDKENKMLLHLYELAKEDIEQVNNADA